MGIIDLPAVDRIHRVLFFSVWMFQALLKSGQASLLVRQMDSRDIILVLTPSIGDSILVQLIGAGETGKWFEGRVHIVHKENVGMRFHGSFHAGYSISQRYRARFKLNRYPLRRQHQALETAFSPERILFPKVEDILQRTTPPVSDIRPRIHNRLIAGNPAQILAVASIVRLPAGSPPFCLFGP